MLYCLVCHDGGCLTEIQLLIHKNTALLIRALISGAGLFVWRTVMFLSELLQRECINLACLSGRVSGKETRGGRRGWRVDIIYECISGQTYRWVTHVTYIGTDKSKRLVCSKYNCYVPQVCVLLYVVTLMC